MIFIVEGPDNSGKSTLATWLAKRLQAIYLKSERVPATQLSLNGFDAVVELAIECYPHVVCDRHPFISERIYSEVLRGGSKLIIPESFAKPVAMIYCRPPLGYVLASISARDQMEGVEENITKLYERYDSLLYGNTPAVIYDYTRHDRELLLNQILAGDPNEAS